MDTVYQNHFKKDILNNKYLNIKMCAVQKNEHGSYFIDDRHTNEAGEISTLAMIQWKDVQYNGQTDKR